MSENEHRVKYFPLPDLACGWGIEKIEELYQKKDTLEVQDINDAIEFYNFYLYFHDNNLNWKKWTKEQVAEIQSLDSVDIITPYLYRTIEFKGEQKTIKSNLFIIEDVANLEYTVFSDDLIIDRSLTQYDNPLFISEELANNAGLSIDSDVTLTLHEEKIRFNIQGIYKIQFRTSRSEQNTPML